MTHDQLFDAITNVKDALVDEAKHDTPAKKRVNWMKWGGIAAAVALVIGAGGWTLSHWRMGASAPGSSAAGGSGHDDGSTVFMSYAGPVFPMTARSGGEDLEAQRHLTYDFSPWIETWWSNEDEANSRTWLTEEERQKVLDNYNEWHPEGGQYISSTDLLVEDAYTLTNPSAEDRTVTLLYPFVSSLRELAEDTPVLSDESGELSAVLRAGGYSGGFQAVEGTDGQDHLLNLDQLSSWAEYKALLSDGRYQEQALEEWPDLSGTPVTVYKFTDAYGPEVTDTKKVPNPTIRAMFELDYSKTNVLSYGFHGARWDSEAGFMSQSFSIPRPHSLGYGEPYYLFVLGDDIQNLTTGGYVTGGNDPDTKTLDGCGVTVERYESDLESALREAAELMYRWDNQFESAKGEINRPDFELYFGLMKEFLCSYGVLAINGVERYHTGWLEDLDFVNVDRVFYLETEVTIPAGERVTVTARMTKNASFDHYCAHTENRGICGYDMVTKLGTNLDFTVQTAETVNTEAVQIVRQNYGFDWENGVNKVTLDQDTEHYYLEVRRANTE